MTAEATLELLLDLKHDLGKYLLLPLALLPRSADDRAVREALERALLCTRTRRVAGGEEVESARAIWQRFASELADCEVASTRVAEVAAVVERALAWERVLLQPGALEREAIERDLGAVQSAIARLIDEVRGG